MAALLVGLLVSWWIVAAGALALIVFGVGWAADVSRERRPAAPAAPPEAGTPVARASVGDTPATRKTFLSAATLGLGAAIGAIVTIPPLVFAGLPPFKKNEGFFDMDVDLGPLENFPEGKWFITQFNAEPTRGDVYDRTAFVRFNGFVEKEPSFTIISNRCVHLGCPVQANGPLDGTPKELGSGPRKVSLTGVTPAGFGCPCHGGQYDPEGNRIAGPPVRALDRYAYKIKNGRLRLVGAYSVNAVTGTGSEAEMGRYRLAQPGIHIDGFEQILYPFIPPS